MKRYTKWMALILCCSFMLTGCGAVARDEMMNAGLKAESSYDASAEYDYGYPEEIMETESVTTDSAGSGKGSVQTDSSAANDLDHRKLIRKADLSIETKTYDRFIAALEAQIGTYGGYVQSGEARGSADRGSRWANYTVRIPADRYDSFLAQVSELGTVTHKSENVQDVTMAYTDVESRIRALEAEYETLLSILEKCTELKDVITVQSRITEVNYQLDSHKSQIRQYDNLISYCTVYLNVSEVERVTVPVEEKTLGQRISESLADNCADIVEDAEDFAVWFVSSLPYFGIWIVIIGGVVVLAVALGRRSRRKLYERRAAEKKDERDA